MALSFISLPILGTHGPAEYMPPPLNLKRTQFAGLNGEVEMLRGRGGRPIRYYLVAHSAILTTSISVVAMCKAYDAAVGTHGTLIETGNTQMTFENCTFEGFTRTMDIIRDFARTLNGSNCYFTAGYLNFYQTFVP